MPVVAAGGLLAIVVGVGIARSGDGSASPPDSTVPIATAAVTAVTEPPVVTVATSLPVVKTELSAPIQPWATGTEVTRLQERLAELGFDPGPIDGAYGNYTQQAVWAFDKLVMQTPRSQVTGEVTAEMWSRMQDPIQVAPRRPTGGAANHVEIYLDEQVIVFFQADRPALVAHMASGELDAAGNPAPYCEHITITEKWGEPLEEPVSGETCGQSKTPFGVFEIERMVAGHRVGTLGGMDDPAYFNYGIAIHGAQNVPLEPASHGCIRINKHLSKYFQTLIAKGDKVLVWGYGGIAPEDATEADRAPYWDTFTPDVTTTVPTTVPPTSAPTTVPEPDDSVPPSTTPVTGTTPTSTSEPAPTATTAPPTTATSDPDTGADTTQPVNPDGGEP